jgi:isoleucyl-tRNA synthetase
MTDKENPNQLHLPQTSFAMKANLSSREKEFLAYWTKMGLYQKRSALRKDKKKFVLHDGPPYANGMIHLGHAVNKILKDIVCKSHFLDGYDTPYVPGWDCHGLPIEINVEKKTGKAGKDISAKAFREACRTYAGEQVALQKLAFERLGITGDFAHPYLTMDFSFEADTVRALKTLYEKGFVMQGFKPVYWCFACQSSLAEAEVEYQDKTSNAVYVSFPVIPGQPVIPAQAGIHNALEDFIEPRLRVDLNVVIWTTTPWTLPANQAVAVNPDLDYALITDEKNTFILADALVENFEKITQKTYRVIQSIKGIELEGIELKHPFQDRTVPIILGEHVTADAGTGAVHTAPAHGEDDFRVGKKYDLSLQSPVQGNGVFEAGDLPYSGKQVFKAEEDIIELLKTPHPSTASPTSPARGEVSLIHAEKITHSYPHCWRHKTPVIFRSTPQWFLNAQKLCAGAIPALQDIQWKPTWGRERMLGMLDDRPDWCISRQRTWGTPITIFIHKNTQAPHPRTAELMEAVAKLIEKEGIQAWFDCDAKTLLGDEADHYDKVTDILDVWFESGVSHFAVLSQRPDLHFPAEVYLEGSDQYRGWFQSALLTAIGLEGKAPYKNLITHGFTIDEKGQKMSKSIGNVIAPEKVVDTLGADILRLWIASTDYTADMSLSDEILKRCSESYRRIRNTARFLLSNLYDFTYESEHVKNDELLVFDRWILVQAQQYQQEIIEAYRTFNFHIVVQKIQYFASIVLGSFYLDVIKDRLYTVNGIARRSAQTVLYHLMEAMVRWMAPILSFTAEEIWQAMPAGRSESVHLESWYEGLESVSLSPLFSAEEITQLISLREQVNKSIEEARQAGLVGSALETEITLNVSAKIFALLQKMENELKFFFISSKVILKEGHALQINVQKIPYEKCDRCWHRCPEISETQKICHRCETNLHKDGEVREMI